MTQQWIDEFLFRGRPPNGPGSDLPSEYQVTIAWQVDNPADPDKPMRGQPIGPLTPAQADAQGWPISRLVDGINEAALAELDAARAQVKSLKEERDAATQQAEKLEKDLAALTAPVETAGEPAEIIPD